MLLFGEHRLVASWWPRGGLVVGLDRVTAYPFDRGLSGCQGADLDRVVGQDPVAGPDPGAFGGVEACAVPSVAAFEGADPAFDPGALFDVAAEGSSVFLGLSCHPGFALAWDRHVGDTEIVQGIIDPLLSVAAVGGDGPWRSAGSLLDSLDRGLELGRVGGVAGLEGVVEHDPVLVVGDLGLVAELDRFAEASLAIGRASGSCRLTRRVAPSGVTPESRRRVWAAICRVASIRSVRSSTARASRPRRRPAAGLDSPWVRSASALARARRSARLALTTSLSASRTAVSARSANSPVTRRTAANASSRPAALRLRSLNPIWWARRPAARDRFRTLVRTAPPAVWMRRVVAAIRPIAFASRPESVG